MPASVPARTTVLKPDRLQFEIGNPGGDVQPGLALHTEGLQRVGILRAADQKIATAADPDRRIGADATVIAREIAASHPAGRRIDRPGKFGLLGEADIQAIAADGCDIGFGTAAFAPEYTFEAGHRADDEADILATLALQDTGANRRQRIGACDRRNQRNDGNTKCRESHESFPRMMSLNWRADRKEAPCPKQGATQTRRQNIKCRVVK